MAKRHATLLQIWHKTDIHGTCQFKTKCQCSTSKLIWNMHFKSFLSQCEQILSVSNPTSQKNQQTVDAIWNEKRELYSFPLTLKSSLQVYRSGRKHTQTTTLTWIFPKKKCMDPKKSTTSSVFNICKDPTHGQKCFTVLLSIRLEE